MVIDQLHLLLQSYPPRLDFPVGGSLPIPTTQELTALEDLQADTLPDALEFMRRGLNFEATYGLAIFVVRMAIHAARTRASEIFRKSVIVLTLINSTMDFRDLLVVLSIVEDCAKRLGLDAMHEIEPVVAGLESKTKSIIEGYFSREDSMRDVKVMGFSSPWWNSERAVFSGVSERTTRLLDARNEFRHGLLGLSGMAPP